MPALLQHSNVVVADLDSCAIYYGIKTDEDASLEERFKQCGEALCKQIPAMQTLAMSFRKSDGVGAMYSGASMHRDNTIFSTRLSVAVYNRSNRTERCLYGRHIIRAYECL